MMTTAPFLFGLAVQAGQIVAFGAQNLFVLRQGISRHCVFCVVAVCAFADLVLVGAGVYGVDFLARIAPVFVPFIRWSVLVFLGWYGARCLLSAFRPKEAVHLTNAANAGWQKVGMQAAAVSFLNPHVWLDAFVVLGSLAQHFHDDGKHLFFLGAVATSIIWFAGLGYGARILSRPLSCPMGRRALDLFTGLVMWAVAVLTVL
jgi:L-lysine exporter family protein LysE/ArgO